MLGPGDASAYKRKRGEGKCSRERKMGGGALRGRCWGENDVKQGRERKMPGLGDA